MNDLFEKLACSNDPKEIVSFYLEKEMIEKMNVLCKQLRIPKSKFVRECISQTFLRLEKGLSEGYVYFIRGEGTNYFKIGKTKDVEKRKKELQCGCPFNLVAFATIECYDMDGLEKAFHQYFSNSLKNGEWFELSYEDIDWIHNQKYLKESVFKQYIY